MRAVSFLRLFGWHAGRYLTHHRLLSLFNVLSVALGVAVYLAVQIANGSAMRAFAAGVDLVAGKADLQISGSARGIDERTFPRVGDCAGISAATPLVRGFVALPDLPGEYLDVLGVDVFSNQPFRTFEIGNAGEQFEVQSWLGRGNQIAITRAFADKYRLHVGDSLRAQVNGREQTFRLAFILRGDAGGISDSHIAAMDIGWAQELFERRGELTSIQLRLAPDTSRDRAIEALRKIVPADATIAAPAQRTEQIEKLLGSFNLNLTAMSLVSLLVGMFLIYNSVSASVVRRRNEIGILRSLGASRGQVRGLFLGEALALGGVGSICGLLLGVLLARLLVRIVARTISSIYVVVNVNAATLRWRDLLFAVGIGLISTTLAAWLPAREASRVDPVAAVAGGRTIDEPPRLRLWWFAGSTTALAFAVLFSLIALRFGPAWIGFNAAFAVLLGFSLIVPALCLFASASAANLLRRSPSAILQLSAANLARAVKRNAVTIASLAAAVSMGVAVSVMVFSFRGTVETWISGSLVADLYITPAANEVAGLTSFTPPSAVTFLRSLPEVEAIDTFREIEVPVNGEAATLAVVGGDNRRQFQFVSGDDRSIVHRFRSERCVVVSESFARRRHVAAGDVLEFATAEGPQRLPIAGVFYEYSRDQGIIYINAQNFIALWHDDRVNSVAVYLRDRGSADAVTDAFRSRFSTRGQFAVFSNASLRQRVFEVFDQTFAVTHVLRLIAIVVALIGISLSLTTLILERARELAVLRAIGASARQVRQLLLSESGFVAALAAIVGVASGLCLAVVLTGVINRAFFGWTIRLAFPWKTIATTPLWIIAAALVAAWLPAMRAAKMPLAESLREE